MEREGSMLFCIAHLHTVLYQPIGSLVFCSDRLFISIVRNRKRKHNPASSQGASTVDKIATVWMFYCKDAAAVPQRRTQFITLSQLSECLQQESKVVALCRMSAAFFFLPEATSTLASYRPNQIAEIAAQGDVFRCCCPTACPKHKDIWFYK